jgi:predicted NUDIX family NTP pyrophosphohydrolase
LKLDVASNKISAGLLLYHRGPKGLEVLLAHPGGPLYARKDEGVWTIPKGVPDEGETDLPAVARREFCEETGLAVEDIQIHEKLIPLGEARQKSGKVIHIWAIEGDVPPGFVPRSNTFEMEWPPHSGRRGTFPEIDRAELFTIDEARRRIAPGQAVFLDRLVAQLS